MPPLRHVSGQLCAEFDGTHNYFKVEYVNDPRHINLLCNEIRGSEAGYIRYDRCQIFDCDNHRLDSRDAVDDEPHRPPRVTIDKPDIFARRDRIAEPRSLT
jgi:hypothetical protein